jgi:hypothetical protein
MAKWDKPVIGPTAPIGGPPIAGPLTNPPLTPPFNTGAFSANPFADGVQGESYGYGVHGISHGLAPNSGVWGENTGGGFGVYGSTNSPGPSSNIDPYVVAAVWGNNLGTGAGVKGIANSGDGVSGFSYAPNGAGVKAVNGSNAPNSFGLWAWGAPAGHFEGDVEINGNLTMLSGGDVIFSDFAEDFDIGDAEVEPGTVMAIDQDGALRPSNHPYDKRVAGVVSGAGDYRPAIVLGNQGQSGNRRSIALVGKVYCKVDARDAAIEIGDLLTTSPTSGHAMKAQDPVSAFGAVIGKALKPLKEGQGLIPILVALQ